ncbi:MAG TPA: cytochrome P450 [Acidimicrobiia bacterium]
MPDPDTPVAGTFDYHHDPRIASDPFGVFDAARGQRAFQSSMYGGYWVLTEAADIRDAFQHPELFSSRITGIPPTPRPRRLLPLELDPPEHGVYRHPLAAVFSPQAVARLEPAIRATCVGLLDRLAAQGACEFLADFAVPFPTTIFVELLGLPAAEATRFAAWNHALLHAHDRPEVRADAKAQIAGYLDELVTRRMAEVARREGRGDDLFAVLTQADVDGRPLTKDEIFDYAFLLFIAGLDTVTAALGFSFAYLAANPEHRKALVADPGLIPAAVEELLRAFSVVNPARTVTRDMEFAGACLREGDRVLLSTVLANRDPAEFDDATGVRFDRTSNRHLAFGAGPHRCLGSHLARCELKVALEEFHRRIPDYRIADGAVIRSHGGGAMGVDHLPLTWEPA